MRSPLPLVAGVVFATTMAAFMRVPLLLVSGVLLAATVASTVIRAGRVSARTVPPA